MSGLKLVMLAISRVFQNSSHRDVYVEECVVVMVVDMELC
jgi:hypothetical protein